MASNTKKVVTDLSPFLQVYNDGTVERFFRPPYVPPSPESDHISSKDITISPEVSARLYLPKLAHTAPEKLPIFVYFHGGGFCMGSAFTTFENNYLNAILSHVKALTISVDYRLAPEHPLPAAYEDCWTALQYIASHSNNVDGTRQNLEKEPWLINYGDLDRLYIGGDSAGGNIAHNIAMRASVEQLNGGVKILGGFLSHPFFWGSKPIGSEPIENHEQSMHCKVWNLAYPSAAGGIDCPMINPFIGDAPSLEGLGCSRLLVCVAEKDDLKHRGVKYVEAVRESGWQGEVELVEVEGEGHCFQVSNPHTVKANNLIQKLASFIV